MGLLRDSRNERIDITGLPTDLRKFRLGDPEAHQRRIAAFSEAIGTDLFKSYHTNKEIILPKKREAAIPNEHVNFDTHNEGFIHPVGVISEAIEGLKDSKIVTDPIERAHVGMHLATHSPFQSSALIIPSDFQQYKNEIDGITQKIRPGNDMKTDTAYWEGHADDTQSPSSFKRVHRDLENHVLNALRSNTINPHILNGAMHSLNNPKFNVYNRSNNPHRYSGNFIRIHDEESGLSDMYDIEKENWADIHPDGYFPN